jgi:integrase
MTHQLRMKYLTYIKGLPYYQRRYPTRLKGHPSLRSATFKRPLHVDKDDLVAIAKAVEAMTKMYEDYISLLESANSDILADVDLERKAQALLRARGWSEGVMSIDDPYLNDNATEYFLDSGEFDDLFEYTKHPELQAKSPKVLIQERAWKKLKEPPSKRGQNIKLFSEVFDDYWSKNKMTEQNKTHRRDRETWKKFLSYNTGDTLVTEESVRQYLTQFRNQRVDDGVKSSTITKNLSVILAPLHHYNDSLADPMTIKRPKVRKPHGEMTDRKPPLFHSEQVALLERVKHDEAWKELYVLISLHTGSHPSEAVRLSPDNFNFNSSIPTVTISEDGVDRKGENRNRTVPLVFQVDRIQTLIKQGALKTMTSKTPENAGVQIKNLLVKVSPKASAYSLRHTLRHNADSCDISPLIQMSLGGWSPKELGLSQHMAGYGELGKDVEERLLPRRDALLKLLSHLMPFDHNNVVSIKSA